MRTKPHPQAKSGYAFVVRQLGRKFETLPDDYWGIELIAPNGKEIWLGTAIIDGSLCNVWGSPHGIWFWAQTKG